MSLQPIAPQLFSKGRVWMHVEIRDFTTFKRPVCQGGVWLLAKWMRVIRPATEEEIQLHNLVVLFPCIPLPRRPANRPFLPGLKRVKIVKKACTWSRFM